MAIGSDYLCKLNGSSGALPDASYVSQALTKLELVVNYGADTMMDLSTDCVNLDEVRTAFMNAKRLEA